MKNNAAMIDIFDGAWGLPVFLIHKLTPGYKLEPSFLREFPAILGRASPLPVSVSNWRVYAN
ncbi:MAG: hypothetical protein LBB26_04320 [Puniceicoccales bacterium]|jgi:hypothetical protein|nr:hypothetical protein [Puniceicoccales bacterium]